MFKWLKKNKPKILIFFLIISQLYILYISYVNRFPEGYVFSGGDVYQVFDFAHYFPRLKYLWTDLNIGEGGFLQYVSYAPYYLLIGTIKSLFNLSASGQSIIYYLIFLLGSFWAFYYSISIFQKTSKANFVKILLSLVYAVNLFTQYNYIYTWNYTPFLFLYILIPPFFALTYKYFTETSYASLAPLAVLFLLDNISNGNLAFFVGLNLFLVLFITLVALIRRPQLDWPKRFFLKKIILYYLSFFLLTSYSVLPQIYEMLRMLTSFNSGDSIFDLRSWILWQSVRFPSPFFWTFDLTSAVKNISRYYIFGIVPFAMLAVFGALKRRPNIKSVIFLVMVIASLILLNKGAGIINDDVVWQIFKNPILSSLRSYEKSAVFLPAFVLFAAYFTYSSKLLSHRIVLMVSVLIIAISLKPFYTGKTLRNYAVALDKGYNYLNSTYSYLLKIPDAYQHFADISNADNSDTKIMRMPYSVINSVGWVNYPAWKQLGTDPTIQLFRHPTVQMNNFAAFGTWNYGEYWNKQNVEDSTWILPFMGMLNADTIMYQKDVDKKFNDLTQSKIDYYINNDDLALIYDSPYFSAYKLNSRYHLPHIYVADKILDIDRNQDIVGLLAGQDNQKPLAIASEKLDTYQYTDTPKAEFSKINPTRYEISITNATAVFPLVFDETKDSGWKLYLGQDAHSVASTWFKKSVALTAFTANGYANGWIVDPEKICADNRCQINADGSYNFTLTLDYWPQRILYLAASISLVTFIIIVALVSGYAIKRRRQLVLRTTT